MVCNHYCECYWDIFAESAKSQDKGGWKRGFLPLYLRATMRWLFCKAIFMLGWACEFLLWVPNICNKWGVGFNNNLTCWTINPKLTGNNNLALTSVMLLVFNTTILLSCLRFHLIKIKDALEISQLHPTAYKNPA